MTVGELIKKLSALPQSAEVMHLWDGECRTTIQHVYLSKTGVCVTADNYEPAYSNEGRPVNAPSVKEKKVWHTPLGGK